MKRQKMLLMQSGYTGNGFMIKDEMILNSLDSFIDKPIVLNKNEEWIDYTDEWMNRDYFQDKVVGVIKSVEFLLGEVIGDVLVYNDEYVRNKFDNWQISFKEGCRDRFNLESVEIFGKEGER